MFGLRMTQFTRKIRFSTILLIACFCVVVYLYGVKEIFSDDTLDIARTSNHGKRIPNIVHFIWFDTKDKREFGFVNYLSVLSAYRIQKPDEIMFHCDRAPTADKWWTQLSREVPLTHLRVNIQTQMMSHTGQNIDHPEHITDILRLQVLHKYGGIYIDLDAIVVQNLNPLRNYPAVLGQELDEHHNSGCVMSEQSGALVTLWLESYRNDYNTYDKTYNSRGVPYQISLYHPDLVHVEVDILNRERSVDGIIDWRSLYVIHLQHDNHSPKTIENTQSTSSQILSYVYKLRKEL